MCIRDSSVDSPDIAVSAGNLSFGFEASFASGESASGTIRYRYRQTLPLLPCSINKTFAWQAVRQNSNGEPPFPFVGQEW